MAKWRAKGKKRKPSFNGLVFFSWPSLYPFLCCSHRHHFQPNYPLSLAPLAAYGNVNCRRDVFLFFFSKLWKVGSSWGEWEEEEEEMTNNWNRGAAFSPNSLSILLLSYTKPPMDKNFADLSWFMRIMQLHTYTPRSSNEVCGCSAYISKYIIHLQLWLDVGY